MLGQVMTVACTYEISPRHSGRGIGRVGRQTLLEGHDEFYERIYRDLGIAAKPVRWEVDQAVAPVVNANS